MTTGDTTNNELMKLNMAVGRLDGKVEALFDRIDENQTEFRSALVKLFEKHATCPGPRAAEIASELRIELDKHLDKTMTTKPKTEDKTSRPPGPRAAFSERTVQMFLGVLLVIMAAMGVAIQVIP